ncbi:MAG: TolC family outer membrane protein [Pacificimonas sp.]
MTFKTGLIAALLMTTVTAPALAETLKEAMAAAYASNPEITAARAGQRLSDEELVRAKANILPSLNSQTVFDQETSSPGTLNDESRLFNSTVELRQPIYRGGQTVNGIRAADRRVLAGREQLRATENQLIFDTVQAYLNVLSDQSEVELTSGNVRVLERQLQASTDRFEVGDVTRTDVAQSEARLALARSQAIAAEGNLQVSRNAYQRIVGRPPVDLQPPPPLPPLPQTQAEAVAFALQGSPFVISARLAEEAARFDVKGARGARLPTLDATFSVGYSNFRGLNNTIIGPTGPVDPANPGNPDPSNVPIVSQRFSNIEFTQNIGVTMTIPLYAKGQLGSQIRSTKARALQLREQAVGAERNAVDQVRTAFENLLSARATIRAATVAVDANDLALEGTRAEQTVGTRNILDVLNAEQELLNAQVQLVRAERNSYVAAYALLAAIGQAEVDNLAVPVEQYNAPRYLDRADDRWFDWAAEFDTQPVTTMPLEPGPLAAGAQPQTSDDVNVMSEGEN